MLRGSSLLKEQQHDVVSRFLIVAVLMVVIIMGCASTLANDWCNSLSEAQKRPGFSLCSASLADRRPSWCTYNNFRASQPITFRDHDIFNCADARARCLYNKLSALQKPMATLTENNLICVKDQDVDNIVKMFREDFNGNNVTTIDQSSQPENNRCYFVRAVKPIEMVNEGGAALQYLLVLTNRFLFVVNMDSEAVDYSYPIIETTTKLGDFKPFKMSVHRNSGSEATIYVILPEKKLLVLKLDLSGTLTITQSKSLDLTGGNANLAATEFVQDLQTISYKDPTGTAAHMTVLSYGSTTTTNGIIIYKSSSLSKWTFKDQTEERKIFIFAHGQFVATGTATHTTRADCNNVEAARPIILIQSKSQINLLQLAAQNIDSAIDLTTKSSIIYTHEVSGESIYSASAFTECYGTVAKSSQSVWVSVGVASTSSSSNVFNPRVIVFNLPEMASKTVSSIIDSNQIYTATGLDTSCSSSYSSNSKPQYSKSGTCTDRPIKESDLSTKSAVPSKIVIGMYKTSNVASPDAASTFYHTINIATRESIEVFSFQEFACADSSNSNSFSFYQTALLNSDGKITDIYLSENAQHLFAVLSRKAFDIDARTRLQDICELLSSSNPPSSLTKFADACKKYPTKYNAFDFISYFSMCNGGWTCPRFGDVGIVSVAGVEGYANVVSITAGFHTVRPTTVYKCEKGFYCPSNNEGRRRICPTGFKCDKESMLAPVVCDPSSTFSTTCEIEGSSEEQRCPDGQICLNAMKSVPAPPGFMVRQSRSVLFSCRNGQYCPLATQGLDNSGALLVNACPVLNFCETPHSITPTPCLEQIGNRTQYCPAGTFGNQEHYCPEGFYCPTLSTRVLCEDGYYCPRGTKEPLACTAGYYCPNTNSMLLCPSGYHCAAGSTYPKRCQWFSYCPEGSAKQQSFYLGILLMFLVVFLVLVTFVVVRCVTASYKKKKMKQKKIKQDQEISSQNALANIGINIANFIQGNDQFNYDNSGSVVNEPPFSKKNFTIDYAFEDLSYVRKKSEEVCFEGANGRIYHGRTTCIIGVDNEAITSLLNTLAGRHHLGFVHGKIMINEQIKDPHEFRNIISFAPKQLDMAKELKVHELLRFAGHSRLPSYFTYSQVGKRVEKTCKVLGIENFMYDTIGKSKKHGLDEELRVFVNMALEMVADPVCLFVDNPFDEIPLERKKFLCKAFKLAAESGTTVVSTMSRPRNDVFLLFDDCIIMGKNGGIVYNGPTKDVLRFFEEIGFKCPNYENPPDFFIDVCLGNVERPGDPNFEPERLLHLWELKKEENDKKWLKSRNGNNDQPLTTEQQEDDEEVGASVIDPQQVLLGSEVAKERQRKPIGFLGQYLLFSLRALLQLSRHYKGVFFDFFFHFALAVIIGGFYFNMDFIGPLSTTLQKLCPTFISNQCSLPRIDKIAPMSIVTVSAIAIAAMQSSLKCFGADKELYRREAQNGINKMSYFLGKLTGEIPSLLIYPLVFVTFWYILVNPEAEFYTYYGLFLLFEIVFSSLGYFVSVFVQRTHAEFVGVMYIILCALLGGVQPTVRTMSKEWYTLLLVCSSPVRWAVELMYTVEIRKYQESNQNVATALDNYGFSYRAYYISPIILISITFIFMVLSFVGLVMRDPQAVERIKTLTRVYIRKGKRKLKKLKSERKKSGDYVFQQASEIQVLDDGEESESDEDDELLMQQDEVYQPPSMQQEQQE